MRGSKTLTSYMIGSMPTCPRQRRPQLQGFLLILSIHSDVAVASFPPPRSNMHLPLGRSSPIIFMAQRLPAHRTSLAAPTGPDPPSVIPHFYAMLRRIPADTGGALLVAAALHCLC